LRQAMERLCVASVAREPTHELDAVHVAFLVAVDQEREVERVIEDLAHEWEGRIDVQLLGPMAAYDFAGTVQSES
jgi:gas vesicle protein GvpL/GvpF